MIDILAGVGVVTLVFGAGFFVNYMEKVAEKRKQDRLEEFYKETFEDYDDDWWNEHGI